MAFEFLLQARAKCNALHGKSFSFTVKRCEEVRVQTFNVQLLEVEVASERAVPRGYCHLGSSMGPVRYTAGHRLFSVCLHYLVSTMEANVAN